MDNCEHAGLFYGEAHEIVDLQTRGVSPGQAT